MRVAARRRRGWPGPAVAGASPHGHLTAPAGGGVPGAGLLPLHLGRQPRAGPGGERLGLVEADVLHRLVGAGCPRPGRTGGGSHPRTRTAAGRGRRSTRCAQPRSDHHWRVSYPPSSMNPCHCAFVTGNRAIRNAATSTVWAGRSLSSERGSSSASTPEHELPRRDQRSASFGDFATGGQCRCRCPAAAAPPRS